MNLHVVGPDGRRYEVQGTGAQIGVAKQAIAARNTINPSMSIGAEFDRFVKFDLNIKKQLKEKYRLK